MDLLFMFGRFCRYFGGLHIVLIGGIALFSFVIDGAGLATQAVSPLDAFVVMSGRAMAGITGILFDPTVLYGMVLLFVTGWILLLVEGR